MVGSTELLDALKSIGLNLYERKIFVALLARGLASPAEVSEIAGVPRSRSYDILESLASKGFVLMQPGKPIKYVALPPAEALDRTKQVLAQEHETMLSRIDKMLSSSALSEMEKMHKQGLNLIEPTEVAGTLKGKHAIHRQMQGLFRDAEDSIHIAATEAGLNDLAERHLRVLRKVAKRGVRIRVLAPAKRTEAAKALREVADVRHTDQSLGRFAIVDDKHVVLSLTDDKVHETQDIAFWAQSKQAANNFAKPLFAQAWQSAKAAA